MRKRVLQQPAFVLHSRAYSESSVIAEVLTQHHGRLVVLAKGAKRLKSPYRGLLQAFQPLRIGFSGKGELLTLTAAEFDGRIRPLFGRRLYCGFYVNELVLRLTHRHDPIEEVFANYDSAIAGLADPEQRIESTLRAFEVNLLASLGYGLVLEHEADDALTPIVAERRYEYIPDRGPIQQAAMVNEASRLGSGASRYTGDETVRVGGDTLIAMRHEDFSVAQIRRESKRLLRHELERRLDGRGLRSRGLMHALRHLQATRQGIGDDAVGGAANVSAVKTSDP